MKGGSQMKRFLILFGLLFFISLPESRGEGTKIYFDDPHAWPHQPEKLSGRGGRFYVATERGKIAVIDPRDHVVMKMIALDAAPRHLWVVPGMRYLYVTHLSDNRITVIDTESVLVIKGIDEGEAPRMALIEASDQIIRELKTGASNPFQIAFSPTENLALVSHQDPDRGEVTYIDTERHEVIGAVKTNGKRTGEVVFTHDGKFAFIGHEAGPLELLDVKKGEILKAFPVENPGEIRLSPDGEWLLVNSADGYTAVVSVSQMEVISKIDMPSQPVDVAFSPDGRKAYVGTASALVVIDLEKGVLKRRIPSRSRLRTLFVVPHGRTGVVTADEEKAKYLLVVHLEEDRVIKKISLESPAHTIQFSADGKYGMVSTAQGDFVTLIDAKKLQKIAEIGVGSGNRGVRWIPND